MKFCNQFALSNFEIIVKHQIFTRISGSQFEKWLLAQKGFLGLSTTGPLVLWAPSCLQTVRLIDFVMHSCIIFWSRHFSVFFILSIDCRVVCHPDCKERVPLPCLPCSDTPGSGKKTPVRNPLMCKVAAAASALKKQNLLLKLNISRNCQMLLDYTLMLNLGPAPLVVSFSYPFPWLSKRF